MKKGIRAHDLNAFGLKEINNICKNSGIEYVQLALEQSVEDFQYGKFSLDYAERLSEELGETKIAVLSSYINPSSTDKYELKADMDKFKEKIRYANVLKPLAVGTETGCYEGGNDTEEAYMYLLKNMKELVDEAKKYDVNIAIEGVHCFVINTPQKMSRLIKDLNSDIVKVIFDPANFMNIDNYMYQDEIINDTFELLGDKIIAIHVKDFVINNEKMQYVVPGNGILNYGLILENLNNYNIDIPLIMEGIGIEKALIGFKNLKGEVE